MAAYSWSTLHPVNGGRALTTATKRKLVYPRKGRATASFGLSGNHDEAGGIEELVTDILVRRDNELYFRGRVGPTGDDADENRHDITVTAGDFGALLDRRLIYEGGNGPFSGFDIGVLAAFLVTYAQGQYSGDLGILDGHAGPFPDGSNIPAGIWAPDITFPPGKSIAACLDLLAATGLMDWEIDAEPKIVVYPGGRYRASDVVLDYGGAVAKFKRTFDPSTFANAGYFTGADTVPPEVREDPTLITPALHPEGRFEIQYGNRDILDSGTLVATADAELARRGSITPGYVVTLTPGFWRGKSHIWPGDVVTLRIKSLPRLNVLTSIVVEELTIEDDDNEAETVSLTLGWGFPTPLARIPNLDQRIRDLERT